jgi:hypothetical protein
MACKDPAVERLNKLSYNMVKLPRAGIEPLDVLGRDDKTLNRLGSIVEVWTSSTPPPTVSDPQPAASIDGEKTGDIDLGIGLKLLSNALAGLGSAVGLPSLGLGFKKARKVQFKFVDVVSQSVTPFALGKFLSAGTLDLSNPFVSHYFDNEETQEYIIFEVLKSNAVSITAKNEHGANVDADITALQSVLTANVKAAISGSSSSTILFEGASPVTFAFKAYEVSYEGNKWIPKGAPADSDLSFAAAAAAGSGVGGGTTAEPGILLSPGRSLRIR